MKIIGRETIHPLLFYSGKGAGYLTWVALLLSLMRIIDIRSARLPSLEILAYALLAAGLALSAISMVNLGRSTTLGLPVQPTAFKSHGLYRLSRNPMYVGFGLMTLASIAFHLNVVIAAAGLFSLVVYHLIILGEERFLAQRFGKDYLEYRTKVRRYL